ncbi:MAG TPA: low temperature requirement protein A [Rugosimonospora sp.]
MTSKRRAELVRGNDAPERATLLELLFDVAYVAALAVISVRLAGNTTLTGIAQLLVLLMAIWWTWSITAELTDFFNPQTWPIQAMVASSMFGTILLAATIPFAFGSLGWAFAGVYVATHVGRGVVLVSVLRGHRAQARVARFLFWFAVSGIFWVLGAFASDWARFAWWLLAIAIDYVAGGIRYPTPRLGRVPLEQYDQASGGHLGERYQQFIILALGDLILVPTLRIGAVGFTPQRFGAFLAAFATTLLLWQIYVFRAGAILQVAINLRPGRISRWAPYTHLLGAASIVSAAAGFDLVIVRPTGDTPVAWTAVIVGGPILFLGGRTVFEYVAFRIVAWSRLAWVALLIAIAPTMAFLPPVLTTTTTTTLVLCGIVVSDAIRAHWGSRSLPDVTSLRG